VEKEEEEGEERKGKAREGKGRAGRGVKRDRGKIDKAIRKLFCLLLRMTTPHI